MATNRPKRASARPAVLGALARTSPPKLANLFASLDAEQTKKTYADLSKAIRDRSEAFEGAYRVAGDKWKELTPCLAQMRSLLSQRGEQRQAVLREAGLPGWTEWFERFKRERGWSISMRAVQKRLAAFRDGGDGGKDGKAGGPGRTVKPQRGKSPFQRGYEAGKAENEALLEDLTNVVKEISGSRKFPAPCKRSPAKCAAPAGMTETRRMVAERNPDAVLLEEGFDECIIGMTIGPAPARAIYSYELLADAITKNDYADDTREAYEIENEVEDFICYNILSFQRSDDPNEPLVLCRC